MFARLFLFALVLPLMVLLPAAGSLAEDHQVNVVVSIKPIHSLVAAVGEGRIDPILLVDGAQSPHDVRLKPSQIQAIRNADLVIWMGPQLETFLKKPLDVHQSFANILELASVAGKQDGEGSLPRTPGHGHENHSIDLAHGWLDPDSAVDFVRRVESQLAKLDPGSAGLYRKNAEKTLEKLSVLATDIETMIQPLQGKNVIFFHDAYGSFESRYSIRAETFVLRNPHAPLGLKHARKIQELLQQNEVVCLFSEPQFSTKLVERIVEGTAVNVVELDPLGATIASGPEQYFTLMRNLARSMRSCIR